MEFVALLVAAQLAQASVSPESGADLRVRCAQLISFYDRYGVGRSNNSDGRRNHTRLGAEFDCQRGDFQKGIAIMEDLIRQKAFTVPPPRQPVPPLESPEYGD
jgi:hypothetical protein